MNQYELMVLVSPAIGGDAINKRLDEVRKLITSHKGEVFYEDPWGLRDLAYKMKGQDRGFYAVFDFNLDPEAGDLNEIDTTCRLENEILRHIIVRLPSGYEPKSLAEMNKEEEEALAAMEAQQGAEQEKAPKQPVKKTTKKAETKKKEEPQQAVEEAPKKAEKPAEKPKVEESKEPSLEDVDAKLKSIIENPDLNF